MTVPAHLVAEQADIDLQRIGLISFQFEPVPGQAYRKRLQPLD
jgi:hypothetical protein